MMTFEDYNSQLQSGVAWLLAQVLPSGAIRYTDDAINPYYANIAATALASTGTYPSVVEGWINWYINHFEWPNRWGIEGCVCDYQIQGRQQEISTGDADSTDSYAATFLTLCARYFACGGARAQNFLWGHKYPIDVVGGVIIKTKQSDGLTWAKLDYKIKYLMDNCEVYRGLRDYATLLAGFGDATAAEWYDSHASDVLYGIHGMTLVGGWACSKDAAGKLSHPNTSTWYPDAVCQLWPALCGVVAADDPTAASAYASFNVRWPAWPTAFAEQFPWVSVACAAAQMRDTARVQRYMTLVRQRYAGGFQWPWYSAEAGWWVRLNRFMLGGRML
jgi:hypothetical protein